jgi:hypothetical protein
MTHPGHGQGEAEMTFQLFWPENTGAHAEAVNQVVFAWDQNYRDTVYMHLGHVATPLLMNPEAVRQRLESGNRLDVEPMGSFVMSRGRAEELWRALGQHLGLLAGSNPAAGNSGSRTND